MARVLPTRVFFKDTWFEFPMNRGPFNIKEHVLITIIANAGAGSVYATYILSVAKLSFLPALLLIAPFLVWLAHKAFPGQTWIRQIRMPVLLGATSMMPPATAVNFTSWIIVAFISGYIIYKYKQDWWKLYNYVLSGGLDAGTAFKTILLFLTLESNSIKLS